MILKRVAYLLSFLYILLLPVVFIPNVFLSQNALAKVAFSFLCLGVLYILFSFIAVKKNTITFSWHIVGTAFVSFLIVVLFSTFYSSNLYASLWGSLYEIDNAIVFSVLFLTFLFSVQWLRTKVSQIIFFIGFFLSTIPWLLFELFRYRSDGISTFLENGFLVGTGLDTLVFVGGLVLGAFLFIISRRIEIRIRALLGIFIIVMLIIGALLFNVFNTESLSEGSRAVTEEKISFNTTLLIGGETALEGVSRALLGSGPNTFFYQWAKHRPDTVYKKSLWEVKPTFGNNFMMTLLTTTGLLGVFSFLLFVGYFIGYGAFRVVFRRSTFYVVSFVLALYFVASFLFITHSTFIALYAFLFMGLTVSFLSDNSIGKTFTFKEKTIGKIYTYVVMLLFFVAYMFGSTYFIKESYAAHFFYRGLAFKEEKEFNSAIENIRKATLFSSRDLYFRELSSVNHLAASRFEDLDYVGANRYLVEGRNAGQEAVDRNRLDYRNFVVLGRMSAFEFQLVGPEVGNKTLVDYNEAVLLNGKDPILLLERAYASVLYEDVEEAKIFVEKALEIKPNFTEAQLLQKTLE